MLLVGAALLFYGAEQSLYIASLTLLPYGAIMAELGAQLRTSLFLYEEGNTTDIMYWTNVGNVVVSCPLLAVNWIALNLVQPDDYEGLDDEEIQAEVEKRDASIVTVVACVILVLTFLWFFAADPRMSDEASAAKLVNSVTARPGGSPAVEMTPQERTSKTPTTHPILSDPARKESSDLALVPVQPASPSVGMV